MGWEQCGLLPHGRIPWPECAILEKIHRPHGPRFGFSRQIEPEPHEARRTANGQFDPQKRPVILDNEGR